MKAVVLLSGGLDSYTAAAIAKEHGYDLYALTFSYGQRHAVEVQAAVRIGLKLDVEEHLLVPIGLDMLGGSALTGHGEIPKDRTDTEMGADIPPSYVPARNLIFLSIAVSYAEVIGAESVFAGMNAIDYSGYPDCRPAFIKAFKRMIDVGTKTGVEGHPISILAPLIDMSKTEIIQMGRELGCDFSLSHSCYDPGPDGKPCERCDSCIIRRRGFEEANLHEEG